MISVTTEDRGHNVGSQKKRQLAGDLGPKGPSDLHKSLHLSETQFPPHNYRIRCLSISLLSSCSLLSFSLLPFPQLFRTLLNKTFCSLDYLCYFSWPNQKEIIFCLHCNDIFCFDATTTHPLTLLLFVEGKHPYVAKAGLKGLMTTLPQLPRARIVGMLPRPCPLTVLDCPEHSSLAVTGRSFFLVLSHRQES